ncbi:CLIP domain-containing serine protease B4-like isoform X2 [Toxorhynchites rutilus septentrionalis]|nr:CLIP domain-containing serine protease B4-like isoform X2 [Toxorhynchites rutilus septentrionalis]XP_055638365.1 CLIP domain-containing serine protease B4-like isoform X2 [Toxorhynchites rutilus septentrionalis]XP_055638366.1 CLIP domain-containing serine protease B4-like isoform X2 [Toxorhynchites rutilus septentrionalis]XP_055638367.1 CLIP domain-containing serine protease B4-like isoform X2 [Toxorhynchites rutilus septentrionalis]XP_055638368.1 CLIP domain-containing serine protease B4-li
MTVIMTRNMILVKTLAFILSFVSMTSAHTLYWSTCTTPTNKTGSCVPIAECNSFRPVLQKLMLNSKDLSFIESSRCGIHGKKALVCCVEPSGSPPQIVPMINSTESDSRPSFPNKLKLLPSAPACGVHYSNRIVGGERTEITQFPWMALVQHYDQRYDEYAFHCGGSLINELYVVTAAHCIAGIPETWKINAVRLGEWDTQNDPDCEEDGRICYERVQDIDVEKAIVHEHFIDRKTEVHNDIALLHLSRKARYSETVMPICLPLGARFASKSYVLSKMFVSGWGRTETERRSRYKLFVELNGVTLEECRQQYRMANINDRQICAGGEAGKDSCKGDSGGPLMDVIMSNGQKAYYLAGVVSFGKQCAQKDIPGVYTKVNRFSDWILENIEP